MKPPMHHTAYKVNYSLNAYGDKIIDDEITLKCHVRIITELNVNSNNEQYQSDAMFWFEPDSGVVKGDIIKFDGTYYQVERLTEARRLRSTTVQFIKTECLKYGTIS